MKARNETETLQHMAAMFTKKGLLSGSNEAWTAAKVQALMHMDLHAQKLHGRPVQSIADIGVGDMRHLEAWSRFDEVHYMGVDGCLQVLTAAKDRHPARLFVHQPFGQLVSKDCHLLHVMPPDAILLLDVIYHLPTAELEAALLEYVYSSPAEYIILSHCTDPAQKFDGAGGVGEPGFAWFPRRWDRPDGWDIVHLENSPAGMPQKQRLVVLTRSA